MEQILCGFCNKLRDKKKFSKAELLNELPKCNPCKKREYDMKYREENNEKIIEYRKIYRENNREKLNEKGKQYYIDNIEKFREYHIEHYPENREKKIAYSKKYKEEHPEKVAEWYETAKATARKRWATDPEYRQERIDATEEWRKNNPEKEKTRTKKYKEEHSEEIEIWTREYYKRYYWGNREIILQRVKERRGNLTEEQKLERAKYQKEWYKNKMATDPAYKMGVMISAHFQKMLKKSYFETRSYEEFLKYIPYSIERRVNRAY